MKGRDKKNIKGLDISAWQNNINFASVKKEGIKEIGRASCRERVS